MVPERPSPSPIKCVLLGKTHVLEIMIGVAEVPLPVAGSRMVVGGGFVIPAHGLAVQTMLVPVLPGRPRASMTAPPGGSVVLAPVRMPCSTVQRSV